MSLDELKKKQEGVAKTLIKDYCAIVFQKCQRAANCVDTCDGYVTKVGKYFFITFTIIGYLPRTIHAYLRVLVTCEYMPVIFMFAFSTFTVLVQKESLKIHIHS